MNFKAILGLILVGAGLSMAKSPVETYGPLSISGNKMVDSSGKAVTLRGMSLFWHMHDGGKAFWKKSVVNNLMLDWNASVVRAPMGVETSTSNGFTQLGYIDAPVTGVNAITTVADAAIEAGVYVIIDYHAHRADQNKAAASKFFKDMSELYGNTPNIIWEIWNEPKDVGWSTIVDYANTIIPIIRKNSKNVIIVGTPSFSANIQEVDKQLDKYPNLAYAAHFYAASHTWRDRLSTAMTNGHAIFVSEWGISDAEVTGGYNESSATTWLAEMDRLGISGTNWDLGNQTRNGQGVIIEECAALKAGANEQGPWTTAEMTPSGIYMRNYLRSKNPGWTLSDTTTKLTSPLKASPDSAMLDPTDTVLITSGYNKVIKNWILTLTGKTSGAVYTANVSNTSQVSVKWRPGVRDAGSAKWLAGEAITATLTPGNGKTTLYLKAATSVGERITKNASISWVGNSLRMTTVAPAGTPASIRLLDAQGRVEWQSQANIGSDGIFQIKTPSVRGLKVVQIRVEGEVHQALMAPRL